MREIIVEPTFQEQLTALAGQVIVCDSQHRVLGFFSPVPDRPQLEELQLEPPLSIAEIEELRRVKTGKPLEDILARLGVQ
jgi:hypothetical protein